MHLNGGQLMGHHYRQTLWASAMFTLTQRLELNIPSVFPQGRCLGRGRGDTEAQCFTAPVMLGNGGGIGVQSLADMGFGRGVASP